MSIKSMKNCFGRTLTISHENLINKGKIYAFMYTHTYVWIGVLEKQFCLRIYNRSRMYAYRLLTIFLYTFQLQKLNATLNCKMKQNRIKKKKKKNYKIHCSFSIQYICNCKSLSHTTYS